jgi:hypothetical protein
MSVFLSGITNRASYFDAGDGSYSGVPADDSDLEQEPIAPDSGQAKSLQGPAADFGNLALENFKKQNSTNRPFKKKLRGAATNAGVEYARQRLQEKQQDPEFQKKYGTVGNIAGRALQGVQEHSGSGKDLKLGDAARIAKQATVQAAKDKGKEKLKSGAAKGLAKVLAQHPELAGDAERLAQQFVKNKKIDLSGGAVDKLGQNLAKKGLEGVTKGAAKEGTKQLANQALPVVGAVSARDALTGINRGLKDASDGKVISAAKDVAVGVAKSTLVTAFRASYQWEIVGASVGLSLIVTFFLGNVLLIVSNRGISFLEKLAVIAVDLLIFFVILGILVIIVAYGLCGGTVGWGVWLASWVSTNANAVNGLCKALGK